jgi:hypothetical protein
MELDLRLGHLQLRGTCTGQWWGGDDSVVSFAGVDTLVATLVALVFSAFFLVSMCI